MKPKSKVVKAWAAILNEKVVFVILNGEKLGLDKKMSDSIVPCTITLTPANPKTKGGKGK